MSGLHSGVAGAFLADTAASAYSGAPTLSSAGQAAAAQVADGPFGITIVQGSLAALSGYGIAFSNAGNLTISPATLMVAATAQTKVYGGSDPGDWIVACQRTVSSGQRVCEVLQAVQVQGQTAPIARLAIAKAASSATLRLVLVLPSHITIGADPMITVAETDKEGTKATWQRCLPGGCIAEASLTDKIAAQWRSEAGQGMVTFKDGLGRDLTVPFSFRGLAQALDALAKE